MHDLNSTLTKCSVANHSYWRVFGDRRLASFVILPVEVGLVPLRGTSIVGCVTRVCRIVALFVASLHFIKSVLEMSPGI